MGLNGEEVTSMSRSSDPVTVADGAVIGTAEAAAAAAPCERNKNNVELVSFFCQNKKCDIRHGHVFTFFGFFCAGFFGFLGALGSLGCLLDFGGLGSLGSLEALGSMEALGSLGFLGCLFFFAGVFF